MPAEANNPGSASTARGRGRGRGRGGITNARGRGGVVDGRGRGGNPRGNGRGRPGSSVPSVTHTTDNAGAELPNPTHSSSQEVHPEYDGRGSATRGRGGGRGVHRGGQPSGFAPVNNNNIGFLPPPPGLTPLSAYGSRWTVLQPSEERDGPEPDQRYRNVPPGWFSPSRGRGAADRARGREWAPRGFFRGHTSFSSSPPLHEEFHGTWVQFRARGRGRGRGTDSNAQEGLGSVPGEYRGRGRGRGNDNRGSRGRGRFPRVDGEPEREYASNRPWQTRAVEELPPPRDIMEGLLVPASQQLMLPDVTSPDKPISLRTFACVGSYTWRKDRNPTIVVPGSPPRWRERPLPIQVRFDNGIRMMHENKYYMGGASSFTPLFRAVDATTDDNAEQSASALDAPVQEVGVPAKIQWPSVDFVTDRNNLRKLLRWIRLCTADTASTDSAASSSAPEEATLDADDSAGSPSLPDTVSSTPPSTSPPDPQWDPRQDFRIDLILGGEKTVLMERWAPFDRERVVPPKGGCRDNFVREAMAHGPECENGGGHYRIVQYDIGGLRMVVRWEVDSWISDIDALSPATSPTTESESAPTTPSDPAPPAVVDVSPPTVVSVDELARWDDDDNGSGAASWGVPEPTLTVSAPAWGVEAEQTVTLRTLPKDAAIVNIDELAKWDDTANQVAASAVPASTTENTSDTCPIEQAPSVHATDLAAAIAVWDTPAEDASASAANWGNASPQGTSQENTSNVYADAEAAWGVPTNDNASWDVPANDSASWDVPTSDNASWDVPTNDNASWDVPTSDNASWDVPTSDNASWDVPANDGATSDAGRSAGADTLAPKQDLKVIRAGTLLPQSMMLELATRSKMFLDRTNIEDTFLQLFLTQSPVNIVAVHSRGLFDRVILQELASPELAKFNECADIQRSLAQLVALLREIQGIVQEHCQTGRLSLVCEKGQLRVYNRVAGDDDPVLARELARFEV